MNKTLHLILSILLFLFGVFLIWYFSSLVICILISAVLSIIGHPLVKIFDKIKISKFTFPHSLSAFLTLIIMIIVMVSVFKIFVPLIAGQAKVISNININYIHESLEKPLTSFENFLFDYGVLSEGETIESSINSKFESLLNITNFSNIFKNILGFTGSLFFSVFTVLFITFFFLKDEHMFYNAIMLLVPVKYEEKITNVLTESKKLLTRYFIGLCIEITSMITLISIGLSIFGVENALLIGFIGGLMNTIPYLGPVIGAIIGVIIGVTSSLSMELYTGTLPLILTIIGVFAVANIIDNIVFQPVIYSSSVKAHPIEIFLVIIMAGSIAGIPGMILAIPAYTVLRIIAKEFFNKFKIVKKLTEKI